MRTIRNNRLAAPVLGLMHSGHRYTMGHAAHVDDVITA